MVLVLVIVLSAGCFFLLRFLGALQMEVQSSKTAKLVRRPILIDDPRYRRRIHLPTPRPVLQEEEPCTTYFFSASR
jgi:hypothetical protein